MRLNAYLARTGIASRRGADELIKTGRVRVNGVYAGLNTFVQEGDVVDLDGRLLVPQALAYVLLHKPAGVVTTASDPHGRPTVVDARRARVARRPGRPPRRGHDRRAPAHERRGPRAPARTSALRGGEGLRGRGRRRTVGRSARRPSSAASSSTTASRRRPTRAGSALHSSSSRFTKAASTRSSACSKRSATR